MPYIIHSRNNNKTVYLLYQLTVISISNQDNFRCISEMSIALSIYVFFLLYTDLISISLAFVPSEHSWRTDIQLTKGYILTIQEKKTSPWSLIIKIVIQYN